MRELATLQRVVFELKSKKGVTMKGLSTEIGSDYVYLTKQINGAIKITDSVYDKIMDFARKRGIDTTVFETKSETAVLSTSAIPEIAHGLSGTISLSIKLQNNQITGVDWQLITN